MQNIVKVFGLKFECAQNEVNTAIINKIWLSLKPTRTQNKNYNCTECRRQWRTPHRVHCQCARRRNVNQTLFLDFNLYNYYCCYNWVSIAIICYGGAANNSKIDSDETVTIRRTRAPLLGCFVCKTLVFLVRFYRWLWLGVLERIIDSKESLI